MEYDHSLTSIVQAQINRYLEKQMAKAAFQLDQQQTVEELLNFLKDNSRLSTRALSCGGTFRHKDRRDWYPRGSVRT